VPKLCRLDIGDREKIYLAVADFVKLLKRKLPVSRIYLYGSAARGELHEGSDIDLIIVGDFRERFCERIGRALDLSGDLPIEPLLYTEDEFLQMLKDGNPLLSKVLKSGKRLL